MCDLYPTDELKCFQHQLTESDTNNNKKRDPQGEVTVIAQIRSYRQCQIESRLDCPPSPTSGRLRISLSLNVI